MSRSVGMISEGLFTIPTGPWFMTSVYAHMILQVIFSLERLLTNLTLERHLFGVREQMNLQVALPFETPTTGRADKRFIVVVHQIVALQCLHRGEPLVTGLTRVRFLVQVLPFMRDERVSRLELLAAHGTLHVRAVDPVTVPRQGLLLFKAFVAHRTFVRL